MIISHKYKFIFIHIPKCAGTSITKTLVPMLGEHDLVLGCTTEGETLHAENLKKGGLTKHSTAQQIRDNIGAEIWNNYFKFCFVRNPWDLLVSHYHWALETLWNGDDKNENIKRIKALDDFEDYILSPLVPRKNCVDYISDDNGNIIVDYIGKKESIHWDNQRIYNHLGLSANSLSRDNSSEHDVYVNYYNPLTRELIRDWYKNDIQRFNYGFHEIKSAPEKIIKKSKQPKTEYLIIHGAHHKAATSLFNRIYQKISDQFCWKYEVSSKNKRFPDSDTDIFLHYSSNFDFSLLGPYVGTHLIRDPRDMIVSGYYYHLWCNEIWCNKSIDHFNGKSYQEILNSLNPEDGIMFEMSNDHGSFKRTASLMMNWNYNNPYILELKFEDIINDIESHFLRIFKHYRFNKKQTKSAMYVVNQCKFENITGRLKGNENPKNHFRKGISGDWKNHFNESHKQAFKKLYPGLLEKLGYEQNDLW